MYCSSIVNIISLLLKKIQCKYNFFSVKNSIIQNLVQILKKLKINT